MTFENVALEVSDAIATLTIRRPAVRNALNRTTLAELDRAVAEAHGDDRVRALLVTGDGTKAFVAGADIAELSLLSSSSGHEASRFGQAVMSRIADGPKPALAAINGWALGGGCELALACHLRTMSTTAQVGLPEVGLGIIPGYGGTQRLARLVGQGRALELILTGDPIDAQRAADMGLANKVLPPDELVAGSREILLRMLAKGPVAVRLALDAVRRGLDLPLADGLAFEAALFGLACGTDDMHEGMSAFLEKRKPAFRNR